MKYKLLKSLEENIDCLIMGKTTCESRLFFPKGRKVPWLGSIPTLGAMACEPSNIINSLDVSDIVTWMGCASIPCGQEKPFALMIPMKRYK